MIEVGFVTDIGELMRQRRLKRMAVRKAAWIELTAAIAAAAAALIGNDLALATRSRARSTAAS